MEFEDILLKVGGFGKYQRNLTLLFLVPVTFLGPWLWLNLIFMLSVPQHWCHVEEVATSNLSVEEQRRLVSSPSDPSCFMYDLNYTASLNSWRPGESTSNGTDIVPCSSGWQYDKENYDSTAAMKWDLVCDLDHFPSLVFSLTNVGSLFGTPVYGFLSDKYGRKIVFLGLVILVSTTEIVSVFVNDLIVFAILRTINGSVLPIILSLPYILLTELVAPNYRAHVKGLMEFAWSIGVSALPLVAYLTRNWVILGIVVSIAGYLMLLYWRFIPESPCWLISQGRYEDALQIIMDIGQQNGNPQIKAELLSQLQTLGDRIKKQKEEEANDSRSRILKYPRLRRNFLILTFCWTSFYASYGGLTFNIRNLDGNEFLNFFLMSVVEIPGNLAFWYIMHKLGRRWTATFCYLSIGLSCFIPLIGFQYNDVVSTMIAKFLNPGAIMVTDQQASELFPTVARSFGMGAGKTIATAATLFVPYLAYLSMYWKAIPFLIIGLSCLLAGILVVFLPETLDENLPQTISDAENFGKDQKFFSWKRKSPSTDTLQ